MSHRFLLSKQDGLLAVWQKLFLPDYSHNRIMKHRLAFGKDYLSKSVDNLIRLYNLKKD